MNQTINFNKNSEYKTLFNEYVEGAFKASVGVKVTQKDQWINISLAIFNAKVFETKTGQGMSIQLRPQAVKELIYKIQQGSDLQFQVFNKSNKKKS